MTEVPQTQKSHMFMIVHLGGVKSNLPFNCCTNLGNSQILNRNWNNKIPWLNHIRPVKRTVKCVKHLSNYVNIWSHAVDKNRLLYKSLNQIEKLKMQLAKQNWLKPLYHNWTQYQLFTAILIASFHTKPFTGQNTSCTVKRFWSKSYKHWKILWTFYLITRF